MTNTSSRHSANKTRSHLLCLLRTIRRSHTGGNQRIPEVDETCANRSVLTFDLFDAFSERAQSLCWSINIKIGLTKLLP